MALKQIVRYLWNGKETKIIPTEEIETKSSDVQTRTIYVGGSPWTWTIPSSKLVGLNTDDKDINVATCLRLIKNKIAALPWKHQKRVNKDGDWGWEDIEESPILESLRFPNKWIDENELKKNIVQSYLIVGKSHTRIIPGGLTDELWPMFSWRIKTLYDKQTGFPIAYEYTNEKGQQIRYDLEDLIHIKNYDMKNPFEGSNPLSPAASEILANRHAMAFNQKFFENGATYSILFTQDNIAGLDIDEGKELLESLDEDDKGANNAFKKGLLPSGIKPIITQPSIKDMTFDILVNLGREQILAWFGVPPTSGGVMKFASYANAQIEKRQFWEDTLIPLKVTIERGMTQQYLWLKTKDRNQRLILSTDDVDALKKDRKIEMDTQAVGYNAGFVKLNEARIAVNLPADEDGDKYKTVASPFVLPVDDDTDGDDDDDDQSDKAINLTQLARGVQKKGFESYLILKELQYEKLLRTFFKQQLNRVIKNIDDELVGKSRRIFEMQAKRMNHDYDYFMETKDDQVLSTDANAIFKLSIENDEWEQLGLPFITNTVNESGKQVAVSANIHFGFDVTDPNVEEMIVRLNNRSKYFNTSSFNNVKKMVNDAYTEGLSVQKLKKNIRDQYNQWVNPADKLTQARAMTIARTEMVAVVNGGGDLGMVQAYNQGLLEGKEWLTTFDGETRDGSSGFDHIHADGQVVLPTGSFDVSGEKLKYPGDPNGSPGNTINCRCSTLPVKKRKR